MKNMQSFDEFVNENKKHNEIASLINNSWIAKETEILMQYEDMAIVRFKNNKIPPVTPRGVEFEKIEKDNPKSLYTAKLEK